jgi:alkanesulfonate monooxygenase
MDLEFITMAPTAGDGTFVGVPGMATFRTSGWTSASEREPSLDYMAAIARASQAAGFRTLLLPVGTGCLDGWITAAAMAMHTEHLRYLVAVRPGFVQPAVAARQVTTFDYLTGGRLSVNVVTGGSPAEQARDGDFADHETRYRRTIEFVHLLRRLLTEEVVDHDGEFYRLQRASLHPRPIQQPYPPFFIAGASAPGLRLAAEVADTYMMWGETLDKTAQRIADVRSLAGAAGRSLHYSISFQVVLGETEELAWQRAWEMVSKVDPAVARRQEDFYRTADSVGQLRLAKLMEESQATGFKLAPNLWAGLTQVLSGNSIALVGTPDQIADRVVEYVAQGFDRVLLRGFPHLETIERVGREIIPRIRQRASALPAQAAI